MPVSCNFRQLLAHESYDCRPTPSWWKLLSSYFRRLWSADESYMFLFFYTLESSTALDANSQLYLYIT
jgi:hypothetical protein